MKIDYVVPPPEWDDPKTVQAVSHRAWILAPLTLADAPPHGLDYLRDVVPAADGGARGAISLADILLPWTMDPEMQRLWGTGRSGAVAWTAPDALFSNLTKGQDQGEREAAYHDWNAVRWLVLRRLVAESSTVNGDEISWARLLQEHFDLSHLLDLMIGLRDGGDGAAELQDILDQRLSMAGPVVTVALDSGGLRTLALPRLGDLGAHNTASLVGLFQQFPINSLQRCAYQDCGRRFIPAAEGRTRNRGQKFCSEYCRHRANAKRRRS